MNCKALWRMVAQTAAYLLPSGGRLALIYPAWRLVHLCSCAAVLIAWNPKALRLIHSRPGEAAKLALGGSPERRPRRAQGIAAIAGVWQQRRV